MPNRQNKINGVIAENKDLVNVIMRFRTKYFFFLINKYLKFLENPLKFDEYFLKMYFLIKVLTLLDINTDKIIKIIKTPNKRDYRKWIIENGFSWDDKAEELIDFFKEKSKDV